MKKLVTRDVTNLFKHKLTPLQNLLMNLLAGLKVEDLTEKEIKLLHKTYGKDWKSRLGLEKK